MKRKLTKQEKRRKKFLEEKKKQHGEIVFQGTSENGTSVVEFEDGDKYLEINDETQNALKRQLKRFKEKFGRDPEPHEPIFFDPDCDVPTPINPNKITKIMVTAMHNVLTVPREYIYAYIKTDGLLPTEDNINLMKDEDLAEHELYCSEYLNDPETGEKIISAFLV